MQLNRSIQQEIPYCNDRLPSEKLERIVKTINLYSNTSGIKCCDIKFIDDKLLRQKIKPLANNNINITQALHLLLFYTWEKLPLPIINPFNYLHSVSISRAIVKDGNTPVKKSNSQAATTNFSHNVQNTYQALNAGLRAAAAEQVDAFLIEDLHYNQVDKLLQLEQNGFRSVAFLALKAR